MLSEMIKSVSVKDVLIQDEWLPIIDETEIQQRIDRYRLQFKTYQQQEVALGDIVTADLVSDTAKFNRNIKINVGKGFFDKELEEKLCGVHLGESTNIQHSTAGTVTVTATDIQRLQIPPLTDELVERGNLEDIRTAEEYCRYIRKECAKEDILQKAYECLETVISQSSFYFDEGEVENLVEREMERCREIAITQGMIFDDMSEDQLLGTVGQPDIPSFKIMIREMARSRIAAALLALHWQGRDVEQRSIELESIMDLNEQAVSYI